MTSAGEDRLASALEERLAPPWVVYRNVAWLEKRPELHQRLIDGRIRIDGEQAFTLLHGDIWLEPERLADAAAIGPQRPGHGFGNDHHRMTVAR